MATIALVSMGIRVPVVKLVSCISVFPEKIYTNETLYTKKIKQSGFILYIFIPDIDECASHPCVHTSCFDIANGYFCFCDNGYEGTHCDIGKYT